MLQVKKLHKRFGGIKAVNGCSFEVKEGRTTALIGPNGSGKSTVFNLISGLLKESSGSILFQGKDITHLKPEKISNLGISRVFQHETLFHNLSVEENLLLALDNEDTKFWKNLFGRNTVTGEKRTRIDRALASICMQDDKDKLSRDLSFGQKRLIELARAILNPHRLLMLDEPVAGVNPKLRNTIVDMLIGLKKDGDTILLIEHDMNFTLNVADWVIVMEKGKVLAQGRSDEIRTNPRVLEAYLGE